MPFAQGSRFDVGIQVETTYGVAPVTPTLVAVPVTSFGINPSKTLLTSEAFSSDGQRTSQRHGNIAVGGDIAFEFADSDFDEFLQGVMHNTFSAGVLKHGTGIRSYHVEGRENDNTDYTLVTGAVINQLALNMSLDAFVTGTASFIGRDAVPSGTSFDSTMTASSNTPPFVGHEVTVSWKGVTRKASSASLTIANNFESPYVLGSRFLERVSKGFIDVTGSLELYVEDTTYATDFRDEVEDELIITIADATNSYEFLMPRVKLSGCEKNVAGQGSIIATCGFAGVKDSGEATTLKITKA